VCAPDSKTEELACQDLVQKLEAHLPTRGFVVRVCADGDDLVDWGLT